MTLTRDDERTRVLKRYPDNVNYILYEMIWAIGLVMFCLFAAVALICHY